MLYVSCMALVSVITAVVWWVWVWKLPYRPKLSSRLPERFL